MMARMKRASSRFISIFALGAALLSGCENDYDELTEDLKDGGWGDPAPMLPTCVPPAMDATTPTKPDASTGDAATQDSAVSDAGNGDGSTDTDASAGGDAGSPDSGNGDGGDGG